MNAINVIFPYKHQGTWVFDDERVGLEREPFIAGADLVLDQMTAGIPGADQGFRLIFSAQPFPGYTVCFDWRREELGGNWYYNSDLDMEGWLCPALFRYFDQAPKKIYARFEPKGR